jgi:energy-coupling factor transporter ATP-binding protein EcfA2
MSGVRPPWLEEFERNLEMKTWFWLYGNTRDAVPYGETHLWLAEFLDRYLRDLGYESVVRWDVVDGFQFRTEADRKAFAAILGPDHGRNGTGPEHDIPAIREALRQRERTVAVVVDHAELVGGHADASDGRVLLHLAKSARTASMHMTPQGPRFNLAILITDRPEDVPQWAHQGDPLCKTIHIGLPGEEERRQYFAQRLKDLHQGDEVEDGEALALQYAGLTHGFLYRDLGNLVHLSRSRELPAAEPRQLVDLFRFGHIESPWRSPSLRGRLANAEDTLSRRVLGQPLAVRHVADILKRAAEGLSGAQFGGHLHRPKGTLFFAGPSGVGKTELAKAMAELLFGDDRRCLRFDMSEYSQQHSDQRLFGAPPGYVGHEEGGQLTNQVKENPFSVLLFDEIEKAHPDILDKFLQVLDDGRLTSGRGETVYFTECLIVFTSNKGLYREVYEDSGVRRVPTVRPMSLHCVACDAYHFDLSLKSCPECGAPNLEEVPTAYARLREHTNAEIKAYLRPEILNRIGQNIVVFDFIRPPVLAEIVQGMLRAVKQDLFRRRHIDVDVSRVQEWICAAAGQDLELGGRGIGNTIETVLINPLARYLFDAAVPNGATLEVLAIEEETIGEAMGYRVQAAARQV